MQIWESEDRFFEKIPAWVKYQKYKYKYFAVSVMTDSAPVSPMFTCCRTVLVLKFADRTFFTCLCINVQLPENQTDI